MSATKVFFITEFILVILGIIMLEWWFSHVNHDNYPGGMHVRDSVRFGILPLSLFGFWFIFCVLPLFCCCIVWVFRKIKRQKN